MVSVIIPVYNRGHFIKRLRATVDSQTYKDVEILIYDDGSFDGTEWEMNQVLKRSPDPKVRFFELDHKGPSYARNCGIKAAKGEYVAFLDSDDYWTEHHLQRSIHCIETNKADGCYGGVIVDGAQIKATAPEGSES
jgi:glycosyltransferase involved in cell wall biosynthesis